LRLVVLAARKVRKVSFFAQCLHRLAESPLPLGGSSQKKPKIELSLMRRLVAHSKPPCNFWEFFQKLENTMIWDYAGHHDHTLQYKTIIKHVYT